MQSSHTIRHRQATEGQGSHQHHINRHLGHNLTRSTDMANQLTLDSRYRATGSLNRTNNSHCINSRRFQLILPMDNTIPMSILQMATTRSVHRVIHRLTRHGRINHLHLKMPQHSRGRNITLSTSNHATTRLLFLRLRRVLLFYLTVMMSHYHQN